jgi:hypothetical protein
MEEATLVDICLGLAQWVANTETCIAFSIDMFSALLKAK